MKYIERYALAAGLKIGKQYLMENFFPVPFEKYITLHASSGAQGKVYPYFQEVVNLLKPILSLRSIEIVQIGAKDDPSITSCHYLCGKYSFNQGSYIVRNAMLHLGNDSVWGHRAGYLGIPLVQPFGTTSSEVHASREADPSKTIFLESHRWGRKPTFASQENPSTIALIPPEDLANAVLKLLGFDQRINEKTLFVGNLYNSQILEWIPNTPINPDFNPELPVTARMDIEFNEQLLIQVLQTGRKVNILTKQIINPNVLAAFKANILSYNHEVDESVPFQYIKAVKSIIQRAAFFTRSKDPEIVGKLRFYYFDFSPIEQAIDKTKEDFVKESSSYLNKPLDIAPIIDKLMFRTNKYTLSKGKIYSSVSHANKDIPMEIGKPSQVIDDEAFWKETQHLRIYDIQA